MYVCKCIYVYVYIYIYILYVYLYQGPNASMLMSSYVLAVTVLQKNFV